LIDDADLSADLAETRARALIATSFPDKQFTTISVIPGDHNLKGNLRCYNRFYPKKRPLQQSFWPGCDPKISLHRPSQDRIAACKQRYLKYDNKKSHLCQYFSTTSAAIFNYNCQTISQTIRKTCSLILIETYNNVK